MVYNSLLSEQESHASRGSVLPPGGMASPRRGDYINPRLRRMKPTGEIRSLPGDRIPPPNTPSPPRLWRGGEGTERRGRVTSPNCRWGLIQSPTPGRHDPSGITPTSPTT